MWLRRCVSKPCPRMKQSPLGDDLLREAVEGRRRGKQRETRRDGFRCEPNATIPDYLHLTKFDASTTRARIDLRKYTFQSSNVRRHFIAGPNFRIGDRRVRKPSMDDVSTVVQYSLVVTQCKTQNAFLM